MQAGKSIRSRTIMVSVRSQMKLHASHATRHAVKSSVEYPGSGSVPSVTRYLEAWKGLLDLDLLVVVELVPDTTEQHNSDSHHLSLVS